MAAAAVVACLLPLLVEVSPEVAENRMMSWRSVVERSEVQVTLATYKPLTGGGGGGGKPWFGGRGG